MIQCLLHIKAKHKRNHLLNTLKMKKIIVGILILSTLNVQGQKTKKQEDKLAGIDTSLQRLLTDWKCAGFAVAVVQKDKIIYSKGFGLRDVNNNLPVTPNTIFAIGSSTKAFTSTLIGDLVVDKELDITKPIKHYLPALDFYNNTMNNEIKVQDLMCHITGLPRHDYSWYLFSSNNRDSLLARVKYQEPSYGVREKWQYNNFMFLAQGMLAEKMYGKTWEALIKEKILDSLDMKETVFKNDELKQFADVSIGYGLKNDSIIKALPYYNIDAFGPAGSIKSSVTDISKWLMAWINGGKYKGRQVVPPAHYTNAIVSHAIVSGNVPKTELADVHLSNYGYGWFISSYKGHYRVDHGGNIDGFSANVAFFPTDSIGIVVLTNQDGSAVTSLARNLIADKILGLKYYDWSGIRLAEKAKNKAKETDTKKEAVSNRKLNTKPTHRLQDFEGIYSHKGYGSFEVSVMNDSLFAFFPNGDKVWLSHYHYNIFSPFDVDIQEGIDTAQDIPIKMQFLMSDAGEISSASFAFEPSLPKPLEFERKAKVKEVAANELEKYVGDYELSGTTVKVYIKDNKTLFVLVPGQPDYELNNVAENKFALKVAAGFYVQFEVVDGKTKSLTFLQPNGNFKANKK